MASMANFRAEVAEAALDLFTDNGYDPTSVEDIAMAAGISRSTFFRQFRAKEDVIFADHEALLNELTVYLAASHPDPWEAVCQAAVLVFRKFSEHRKTGSKTLPRGAGGARAPGPGNDHGLPL
jgi:AcrR family transcriptional regulator